MNDDDGDDDSDGGNDDGDEDDDDGGEDDVGDGRGNVALLGGRRPVCPEESSTTESRAIKMLNNNIKMFNKMLNNNTKDSPMHGVYQLPIGNQSFNILQDFYKHILILEYPS